MADRDAMMAFLKENPGEPLDRYKALFGCNGAEVRAFIRDNGLHTSGYYEYVYLPEGQPHRVPCILADRVIRDDPRRALTLDIETTGLDSDTDGILSISIIDGTGRVLFDELIHPYEKEQWPGAQLVNGITPSMVRDAPSFAEVREDVRRILSDARVLIGYNLLSFDLPFLRSKGMTFGTANVADVMLDYAPINGVWLDWAEEWKSCKLVQCADHYGYGFDAHVSLEDCRATLHCCKRVARDQESHPELLAEAFPMDDFYDIETAKEVPE